MDNKIETDKQAESLTDYDRTSFDPDLTLEQFIMFRDYINEHSGIFIDDTKLDSLRISLFARATFKGFISYEEYFHFLQQNQQEFNELLNLITINETSFFRFKTQFDVLQEKVLPELISLKKNLDRSIRIWSAGCSTGEEPYSIGMILLEIIPDSENWDIQIYGTDVSKRALDHAKDGFFNEKSIEGVDEYFIQKYFNKINNSYRVNEKLRQLVSFGYHNLIREPYPLAVMSNWDIIFCRNVTIYFRIESTKRVISNFYKSLNPTGYLFIGHSETLAHINDDFNLIEAKNIFYYKKEKKRKKGRTLRKDLLFEDKKQWQSLEQDNTQNDSNKRELEDLLRRSNNYFKQKKFELAMPLLKRLLKNDPDNTQAYLICAFIHANQDKLKEALLECQAALQINPFLPAAHYLLGVIYTKKDEMKKSIEEYNKTIYIDPNFALAHLNLASIYYSSGQYELAEKEYLLTIDSINNNPDGEWKEFLGGFITDLIIQTCENNILELKKLKS